MFGRISSLAAMAALSLCFSSLGQAQFGGVQVQVGGYGSGARLGGLGYGNSIYGSGYGNSYANRYGYGNRYGSGYGQVNGYGNGYGYGNVYQSSYGNYSQPGTVYWNGGNLGGMGYRSSPSYSYGASRYYSAPVRRYTQRRFR